MSYVIDNNKFIHKIFNNKSDIPNYAILFDEKINDISLKIDKLNEK
jgi:hypothetical protein